MIPFINLPVKIVKLFTANVSESEVAAGVCMGLFLGFIPLNGPMAIMLFALFFLFKINRLATMLVLPFFKLLYILGVSVLADKIGGVLLIDMKFLAILWNFLTSLPIVAYLDLGNTLVTGGLTISIILTVPVYIGAKKGIVVLREKYFDRIKNSAFVKGFLKMPIISQIVAFVGKVNQS
ncbi:MAG: DUF2062 domain-containing protein [Candidatus Tantalella remota]|nr:DUF2062 domain-containing protein [Candidatus Tantalella remota]